MKFIVKLFSIQHTVLIPTSALLNAHHPLSLPSHPSSTLSLFSILRVSYGFAPSLSNFFSFPVQVFILMNSQQFMFAFVSLASSSVYSKKLLWILMGSYLKFRSFIHFEFPVVYGVRKLSHFILLPVAVQCSQHHLLQRLSFFHWILIAALSKIS